MSEWNEKIVSSKSEQNVGDPKPAYQLLKTLEIWITRTAWAVFKYCGTKTVPLFYF